MYSFFMDKVRLPVTPGKLDVKIKNKNKTLTLLSGAEINLLKSAGLTEIEFEMLIPSVQYPFARYDDWFKPPEYFLTKIERLKVSKKPFRFMVSRMSPGGKLLYETNMLVSLEDYTISENAEDGMDLIIKVQLKQFREYAVKKLILTSQMLGTGVVFSQGSEMRPAKSVDKTYTVKPGDTLWGICRKELGDGSKYPEVAKRNNIANPNKIYPGQVIRFE
ncbi:LysM peptidoglycan-binding domain-containing protein [Fusibacter bizertensis]